MDLLKSSSVLAQFQNFFKLSNLTSCSFAALIAARMHIISFESPNKGLNAIFLVKSITQLSKFFGIKVPPFPWYGCYCPFATAQES